MALATKPSTKSLLRLPVNRRSLLELALALLFLYLILPQIHTFHESLSAARHAKPGWLALGVGAALATYLAAAVNYSILAQKSLRYWRTAIVEVASTCVDRILPAGIGAMGVNFAYLRKQRHTPAEATAVVATNTLIGVVGLLLLIIVATLLNHNVISQLQLPHAAKLGLVIGVFVLAGALAFVLGFRKGRGRVSRAAVSLRKSLALYDDQPWRLGAALVSSMILTLLFTLSLLACARATGLQVSFPHALLVLALGGVGGTIVPTPGGLIGVEAGLTAGLIAYGASSAEALTAALLYRLVTYWFALALGAGAFVVIRGKGYF